MADDLFQPSLFKVPPEDISWKYLIPTVQDAVAQDSGKLILFTGHCALFQLGHYLLAWRLLEGETVLWVDGANVFDLSLVTRMAKGFGQDPRNLLRRIHLSRAFTIHQLEAVVSERLKEAMKRHACRLCFVSGIFDTFSDPEFSIFEAMRTLYVVMRRLRSLADQGHRVVVLAPDPPAPAVVRKSLRSLVTKAADRIFTLSEADRLTIIKGGKRHLVKLKG